ncbi:class I SAM-dependent DNA methyltransferase [Nocardiopsis potens]|uniref:class I SAM-dependent DNA methyltransferase n=1 Tax=Nocardiopsis potens TaxID=1246458 RepID=UPI00034ADE44|nr:class I SAM-dependent methyltransferase [Nocardiopsis potens]
MYGAEFTEISDLVYRGRGKDYRAEAEYIGGLVRGRMPGAASLLDVGCGTGAHLEAFEESFGDVAGLDASKDMIEAARAKGLRAALHQGDMCDFDLGRSFDAVTCLFGSIGHPESFDRLADALRCFARHLAPGGVAAVDPWWFPETFLDGYVSADVVTEGERTVARVSHSVRDGGGSRMEVHYTVADRGSGVRHFSETYTARLFTRAQYEAAFAGAGLDAEYIEGVQQGRGLFLAVRRPAPAPESTED